MNKKAVQMFADMYTASHPSMADLSKIHKVISKAKNNDNAEDQFMLFASTILQNKPDESFVYLENILKLPEELQNKFPDEIDYLKEIKLVVRCSKKGDEKSIIRIVRMINKIIRIYALKINRFI